MDDIMILDVWNTDIHIFFYEEVRSAHSTKISNKNFWILALKVS